MNIIKIPTKQYPDAEVHWDLDGFGRYCFYVKNGDTRFPWANPNLQSHAPEGSGLTCLKQVEEDARAWLSKMEREWLKFNAALEAAEKRLD